MIGVFDWIIAQKWAITPEALEAILAVVQRTDITSEELARSMHGNEWERFANMDEKSIQQFALEGKQYPRLEGARLISQVDNIALLPVVGPIVPRSSMFSRISGMSSVDTLAQDFNVAMNSDEIDTIILNMDSPGGEITGIAEFANMIFNSRENKKIVAYVYGMAASAGYWIGSSASEIVTSPTGESGSIGVVAAFTSSREADEKKGVRRIEIVSSQSPNKRPDLESNSGRAQIQTIVDELANVFIGSVARNRGVEPKDVVEGFGGGGMFVGSSSIEAGLTDSLGSLESLIQSNLNKKTYSQFFIGGSMDLQEFQTKHSALFEQVKKMGRDEAQEGIEATIASAQKEGAEKENARIKAIEGIDVPGASEIISEFKFDSTETKESIAVKVLDAQKEGRLKIQQTVQTDAEKLAKELEGVNSPDEASTANSEKSAVIKAASDALNQGR